LPSASDALYNAGDMPHLMDLARAALLPALLAGSLAFPAAAGAQGPRQVRLALLSAGITLPSGAETPREVLEDFGFFGRWSPQCDRPPSPGNSLRTTSVTPAGTVRYREHFGRAFTDNVYEVLAAERIAADRVRIRIRLNRTTNQELEMAREDGRLRTMANRPLDGGHAGRPIVDDGLIAASGSPTPWMARCR
jgi:hypothetical protein